MKTHIIIGASSGIGRVLAEKLAMDGDKVIGTFNKNKPESHHKNISYHYFDATDELQEINFLPEEIHGLVYSPGSINLKPFRRLKLTDFIEDFKLQVGGAIRVIQKAYKGMRASKNASVVLFSTVAVQNGFNFHSQVSASKGAIEGLTKALAAEFAPNIRVNSIAPSLTDTPLASSLLSSKDKMKANADRHPLKRIGKAEDIASMARFLLSDEASWVSGQIIHVDGGMSTIKG